MIPIFQQLVLETQSSCNRTCPTCLRNSYPNRSVVASWFKPRQLSTNVIIEAVSQCRGLGVKSCCLQYYNEPLQDSRIVDLARDIKCFNIFEEIVIYTNGDLITSEIASKLDGTFDKIYIALYMDATAQRAREQYLRNLFQTTTLEFTGGLHIPTHFSPNFPVKQLAEKYVENPCGLPLERMILNHKGEMVLCCEDLVGEFSLGLFPEKSLKELWYSSKHVDIIMQLQQRGGRKAFSYCESCPRP